MNEINIYVGEHIRRYRKAQGLTLQQLADLVHKSRASISKYENGEVTLDVETLFDLAAALQVSTGQLLDMGPSVREAEPPVSDVANRSPFFRAKRLYFYFYDGRYRRLKDGIIDIRRSGKEGSYEASLSISATAPTGRSAGIYYSGRVVYSDMLIRFTFVNQSNALEEDLLYIFNPLDIRDSTYGLLCGISSADLMPCAFKCLVTLTPQEHTEELKQRLLVSRKEMQRWQKLNMLIVDNQEQTIL